MTGLIKTLLPLLANKRLDLLLVHIDFKLAKDANMQNSGLMTYSAMVMKQT